MTTTRKVSRNTKNPVPADERERCPDCGEDVQKLYYGKKHVSYSDVSNYVFCGWGCFNCGGKSTVVKGQGRGGGLARERKWSRRLWK